MITSASGVHIPFPDKVEEKYISSENSIRLNISFEKIEPLINDFLLGLSEPLFLVIELPLKEKEEIKLKESNDYGFHSEILYLDGQTKKQMYEILNLYGEILFNDGMSRFGIASHKTSDELFVEKYKIIDIYSKNIKNHLSLMKKYSIDETKVLITAWDTFSNENPGKCTKVIIDNKDIYDVVEELKKIGMYSAKVVKD